MYRRLFFAESDDGDASYDRTKKMLYEPVVRSYKYSVTTTFSIDYFNTVLIVSIIIITGGHIIQDPSHTTQNTAYVYIPVFLPSIFGPDYYCSCCTVITSVRTGTTVPLGIGILLYPGVELGICM